MVETGEVRESGIEIVEEIEGGEGETILLAELPEARDIIIGETAGSQMFVEGINFVMLVEADFEANEMEQAMIGKDHICETVIAVSNSDAESGMAIMHEDGVADIDALLERFEEENF